MLRTKILNWKPVPGRKNTCDAYAVRGGMRWTVKRAVSDHSTFYVLRLNGAVVKRCELLREAKNFAEKKALEMEAVA